MILAKDFLGIYRIQVLSAKSQIEQYSENLEIDQLVFVFTLSFVLVTIEINDLVLFHQIFILPSVFAVYGFFTFCLSPLLSLLLHLKLKMFHLMEKVRLDSEDMYSKKSLIKYHLRNNIKLELGLETI